MTFGDKFLAFASTASDPKLKQACWIGLGLRAIGISSRTTEGYLVL